jgi:hypothetical protein
MTSTRAMTADDPAAQGPEHGEEQRTRGHLLENYGECTAGRHCSCLRAAGGIAGWMGTDCPNWRSWGVRNWEELRQKQLSIMRNRE